MTRPLVIAHRGFSSRWPENTLEAYHAAIEIGADIIETDARLTADHVVVSSHDDSLERLTGIGAAIADHTLAELREAAASRGLALPTLAEALATICPRRPALIDVKTQDLTIIDVIVSAIRRGGHDERVWIGVRDAIQAAHARLCLRGARILAFLPERANPMHFAAAGASAFRVWEGDLGSATADALLSLHPVWVTVGGRGTGREPGDIGPDQLDAVLGHRPHAVLVNDPSLLVRAVAEVGA
jgi:glycerophosphoryl diester phosphodiesterase